MHLRSIVAGAALAAAASGSFAITTNNFEGGFTYLGPGVIEPLGFGRVDGSGQAGGYTPGISPPNFLDNWNFTGLTTGTYQFSTIIATNGLLALDTVTLGWFSGGKAHFQSITVSPDFTSASGLTSITVDPGCDVNTCVWLNIYGWEDATSSPRGYNAMIAQQVPEPESFALLLTGLAVVGFVVQRRRAA